MGSERETFQGFESFAGLLAVVTGGGTGMGRELVRLLAAEGCNVAMCDVDDEAMAESRALAAAESPEGTQISTFVADVSDESQMVEFAVSVAAEHDTDHIELLFNNAGVGGGGSFVDDDRAEWDRTFGICWGGVYNGTRTFLPMLLAAERGHVVNTSSVNGFWASIGPDMAHTAYSAAKFAVKGFTEALITDFRLNAPHLRASVVMPGHIGTGIVMNSGRILGRDPKQLTEDQVAQIRERSGRRGLDLAGVSDEDIRLGIVAMAESFRDDAPMTPAEAATVILDGVRAGEWRILVGDDAHALDRLVRESPADAYTVEFAARLRTAGAFAGIPTP